SPAGWGATSSRRGCSRSGSASAPGSSSRARRRVGCGRPRRGARRGGPPARTGAGGRARPGRTPGELSRAAQAGESSPPSVVKKIVDADGKVVFEHTPRARRVLGERASRQMVDMLKQVMTKGGTGEKIALPGFVLAGKTGTARKLDPATKQYSTEHYMS